MGIRHWVNTSSLIVMRKVCKRLGREQAAGDGDTRMSRFGRVRNHAGVDQRNNPRLRSRRNGCQDCGVDEALKQNDVNLQIAVAQDRGKLREMAGQNVERASLDNLAQGRKSGFNCCPRTLENAARCRTKAR